MIIRILILATFLAISIAGRAEDFQEIPPCDRVEVLRIRPGAGKYVPIVEGQTDGAHKLVLPEDKSNLYDIGPRSYWGTIVALKAVQAPDAELLATLLRHLKPYVHEIPGKPGALRGFPKCHNPPFAYRFYSGDKLVYTTSVCWGCSNLVVSRDGKRGYYYFDADEEGARQLLAKSKLLFPDHPVDSKNP